MSESSRLPRWDTSLYAANTAHHRAYDEWFLDATPIEPTDHLVDVGCGSGDFTRLVADRAHAGIVVGVDPHPAFIEEARSRGAGNQRFVVGTAQELSTALEGETFDGVVSRAALQWVPCSDHATVARQIVRSLRPGGWFRMEMSGTGNIAAVVDLLDEVSAAVGGPSRPWCFPDPGWYLEVLEQAGFAVGGGHVRTVPQRRTFTSDTLWGWLESQTLIAYETDMAPDARDTFRSEVRGRLGELRRHDGTYDQTFVRLDVLAFAP